MKKFYLLATALVFSLSANAQLTEGFEDYPLGPYFGGHWTNWSQIDIADENILIVSDYASEGVQAGYIGGNGIQDAILDVGMKQGGIWTYSMDIYIEFFASGYFNAQHDLGSMGTTGNWAYQSYIGLDPTVEGSPQDPGTFYFASGGTAYSFPYPEETWFNIAVQHDMDNNTCRIFFDGEEYFWQDAGGNIIDIPFGDDPLFQGKINGFDFYSADPSSSMFIDNIKFYEGEFHLGVQDVTVNSIEVYPTVTKDIVNVAAKSEINNIAVYNTLGQQVLNVKASGTTTQINVSSLPAGVYMVKIQSGKEIITKKIVVK